MVLSVQTQNTGAVSSSAPRVTIKTPTIGVESNDKPSLINSTPLEKTRSPDSGFGQIRTRAWTAVHATKPHLERDDSALHETKENILALTTISLNTACCCEYHEQNCQVVRHFDDLVRFCCELRAASVSQ